MSGGSAAPATGAAREVPSRLRRILPHGVMLIASVLLYWAASRIDVYTGNSGRIGPDVWPKAIIVFMGLLCAFEVVKRLRSEPRAVELDIERDVERAAEPAADPVAKPAEHPRKLAGGIVLIAGYAMLVSWIGFFVATALFIAAFPWIGGLRRPVLSAILGIAGSFLLVVLFMRVAYISLPLGEGPFRALSLGLLKLIGVT